MILDLRADVRGSGPGILLLHGFTGSSRAWGDEILDALAESHRVVAVDLPGHGGSPDPPADYDVECLTGDLGRVLDREGLERASWLGYSMGGRMALAAAARSPDRVERLILESASPGLEDQVARSERRRSDEGLARRLEVGSLEEFVDDWMRLPLFRSQRELPATVLQEERRRRLENRPRGLARALRTLGTGTQPSFWPELGDVRIPTLLLIGAQDTKFREIAEKMSRSLPDARIRLVDGAGHTIHLERPAAWLDAVTSFLRVADPGRPQP